MTHTRTGITQRWILAGGLALCGWLAGEAQAQSPGGKPFEDIYRRPTVSPYNQITNFSNNPQASATIYQQMVLPQIEQQRQAVEQLNQRRQVGRLQGQVGQIQRDRSARQLDPTIRPTGHASTYLNYSHYYQQQR